MLCDIEMQLYWMCWFGIMLFMFVLCFIQFYWL